MTVETYQERAVALGIERGALAEGFEPDIPSVVPQDLGPSVRREVSKKVAPPPIAEDLTRFQRRVGQAVTKTRNGRGRGGGRHFTDLTRAFYGRLYLRTTSQALARELGVDVSAIGMAIRGHRHSGPVRARLVKLLTPEECAALPPLSQS